MEPDWIQRSNDPADLGHGLQQSMTNITLPNRQKKLPIQQNSWPNPIQPTAPPVKQFSIDKLHYDSKSSHPNVFDTKTNTDQDHEYNQSSPVQSWHTITGILTNSDQTNIQEVEPPLLEELGINFPLILERMKFVLLFKKADHDNLQHCDLTGPIFIALCLGIFLLLSGKPSFGNIYGSAVVGCIGTYVLLNLMAQNESIDLYSTIGILGYGLVPVVLLAFVAIFMHLGGRFGLLFGTICVLWSTLTASRFFEAVIFFAQVDNLQALQMQHSRYLVSYPIGLLYAFFVIMTLY